MYSDVYGDDVHITIAPHKEILKRFGGIKMIKEYRDDFIMNDSTYNVIYNRLCYIPYNIEEYSKVSSSINNQTNVNNSSQDKCKRIKKNAAKNKVDVSDLLVRR